MQKMAGSLSVSGSGLLCLLSLDLLSALLELGLGLEAHDASTPSALWVVIELRFEVFLERFQFVLVLFVDLGDGDDGRVLLVGECSESRLSLDDAEWNIHFAA